MPVVVILTAKAAPGRYAELLAMMAEALPDTVAQPGAELIRAGGDRAAETVTVFQIWDRIESRQAYIDWRAARGDLDRMGGMLREPARFDVMDLVF
ncbi:MAG: putative quinol monooxygenase [Pikeienuella sp.]|uniref:putative quinol monooxygenase n=1 Tax=Pikeienuella sp. TaxID=2831957 RepID=UPI00391B60EE